MENKIIIRHVYRLTGEQWQVVQFKVAGLAKGETVLATLCGGNMGKVLAATVAKQAASMAMIDVIEMEGEAAPGKPVEPTKAVYGADARQRARAVADALGYQSGAFNACVDGFLDAVAGNDAVPARYRSRKAYSVGYDKGEASGLTIKTVGGA